ncbi:MAG TPA: DUF4398 domain-containing protein [Vicinamibacterales bacterium]|nr:DUF4398 domain-containing protein [Vicinamibacterales bacterium]
MRRLLRLSVVLPLFTLLAGCAEPPHKEMNQALGALDAARAAGAEQYAPVEFAAAADALEQSEQAVTQNDHRLALSLAMDSRTRAQHAAKTAVENRAKARGDAERVLAEANAVLTHAKARLADPALSKLPRRTLVESRTAVDAAERTLQEARAALDENDYRRVMELTDGLSARIQEILATVEKPAAAPAPKKRR